jgi:hypothetical protein
VKPSVRPAYRGFRRSPCARRFAVNRYSCCISRAEICPGATPSPSRSSTSPSSWRAHVMRAPPPPSRSVTSARASAADLAKGETVAKAVGRHRKLDDLAPLESIDCALAAMSAGMPLKS